MKALFITTKTADCFNHVRAWESFAGLAEHHTFSPEELRNDWSFAEIAGQTNPDVIFYIGAFAGKGNPKIRTLQELRKYAPVINLCSDAADTPWHKTLIHYRTQGCFDLQVAIDGAKDAPVDLATLTPVDPRPFGGGNKEIRCGFSGSIGRFNRRSEIVRPLEWFGGLTVRSRELSYEDHAAFMSNCQMILNVSSTGSGLRHHMKGRVIETGLAGAALLEHEDSPIGEWFPEDCYFKYRDPPDAARLIKALPFDVIESAARRLTEEVMSRYTPEKIYTEMLGLVGHTESIAAA